MVRLNTHNQMALDTMLVSILVCAYLRMKHGPVSDPASGPVSLVRGGGGLGDIYFIKKFN